MNLGDLLTYSGLAIVIIGAIILLISGQPSEKKREIFKNFPLRKPGPGVIVKPFRIPVNGKLTCAFSNIVGASGFQIYLSDFFTLMNVDYRRGPKYFLTTKQGDYKIQADLGVGEYSLVIDSRQGRVDGNF